MNGHDEAAVLSIRSLDVAFPLAERTVHAVNGCSLQIASGEIVGLVGESGSGKSVTALACLGLLPASTRLAGSIRVAGQEIMGAGRRELERVRGGAAAMIFQNPATALNPFFTIGRQLVDVIRLHRQLNAYAARREAVDALSRVRLPDPDTSLEKYPHQLSGGQVQRVMIAMALACRPKLIIADEPTTALDVTIQAQIIVLLRELARDEGLAVLFITHDLAVVATLCDRVTVMYAGTVVEQAAVSRLFARPAHPYSRMLLETVPAVGAGRRRLAAIPGQVPDLSAPPAGCPFNPRCDIATGVCRHETPPDTYVAAGHVARCHHAGNAQSATVRIPAGSQSP